VQEQKCLASTRNTVVIIFYAYFSLPHHFSEYDKGKNVKTKTFGD
jgi:hypothetical protein